MSNEIWIAYITTSPKIVHIPDHFSSSYTARSIDEISHLQYGEWRGKPEDAGSPFAKNIQMFVTVTSSPTALITSHMGISTSVEAIIKRRVKGISVDLHSFAAKVMLQRNPERRFMVNAPVFAMEEIMLNALPKGSVFVGTKEMLEIYEEKHWTYHSAGDPREARLVKLMEDYPPLFSVDDAEYDTGRRFENSFKIYDKDEPSKIWLGPIDYKNRIYNWMFTQAFVPAGPSHYIVVDLHALANAKPIERYESVVTGK